MTVRPLAPLPVPVRPRHGETAASYIRRLARANHLRPSYLRSLVCSPPVHQTAIRSDLLASLSGRTAEALEHTLAGLNRRTGEGPPQIPRAPRKTRKKLQASEAIRRDASDPAVPVRMLAARHQVSRRAVLQALTPPGSGQDAPHPPWPAPVLAPLRPLIDAWLAQEPGIPAYKVWERLLDEHNAEISYITVNSYVTRHRAKLDGKNRPPAPQPTPLASPQIMIACQSKRPAQVRAPNRADLAGTGH